jgi:hypothetical protein
VRDWRLQRLLAGRSDAIDRSPMVVRSPLDPAFRQHARDGVSARGVQFFNRLPLSKAHPLQGASFDRMRNVARPRWHSVPRKLQDGNATNGNRSPERELLF